MKAKNKGVEKRESTEEPMEGLEEMPSSSEAFDGAVMVLFPSETWRTVQGMAQKLGVTANEVMSVAIELLSSYIDSKGEADDD